MANIRRIIKKSISDQVFAQLRENIVNGTWKPGDKIPSENQLVSLFGVSRASIRMAVQKMITLGLLDSKAGDGTYVREFTPGIYINELVPITLKPEDQLEIMELRKALETEALRLAVQRATDEDLRELEDIHMRARRAFKKLDLEAYFKEDLQFHLQIFRMSKNSVFLTTVQTLCDILFPHFYSVAKDYFATNKASSDESDAHTSILNALKDRDTNRCIEAYTQLTEDLMDMYRRFQADNKVSNV